jgi:membrane-associated HD superfamily phosphohydrolase
MDGQLDECDLTFRELATIRQSLVKSLCSIYHARITYPSETEEPARSAS